MHFNVGAGDACIVLVNYSKTLLLFLDNWYVGKMGVLILKRQLFFQELGIFIQVTDKLDSVVHVLVVFSKRH